MTKEQIEQMPAGPQMDHLIATEVCKARKPTAEEIAMIKVMAHQFSPHHTNYEWVETLLIEPLKKTNEYTGADFAYNQPRQFSTRIDYAWSLVGWCQQNFRPLQWDRFIQYIQTYKRCGCIVNLPESEACVVISRAALIAVLDS